MADFESAVTQKLGWDVDLDTLEALRDALKNVNASILDVSNTSKTFNDSQEVVGVTLKGTTRALKDFSVSIKDIGGDLKVAATSFNDSANRLAEAQKQLEASARGTAMKSVQDITSQLRIPTNISALDANAIVQAQSKLYSTIQQSGLAYSDVMGIFTNLRQGMTTSFTGTSASVAKAITDIGVVAQKTGAIGAGAFDNIAAANTRTTQSLNLSWEAFFRFFVIHLGYTAFYSFIADLQQGIQTAVEFQTKVSEISTISQEGIAQFNPITGLGGSPDQYSTQVESFKRISEGLTDISNKTGTALNDVAKGMYQAVSNQIGTGEKALAFMDTATKFAVATNSGVESSVNLLSSVLNAYSMDASRAEEVSAVLFKTIQLGRVRAEEMGDSLGRLLVTSSQLGVSFPEAMAAIAELTIKGVRYTEAYTQVNAIMTALIKPTKDMSKVLADMGYPTGELFVQTQGLTGVLKMLNDESHKGSTYLAELLTNVRGLRGAMGLASDPAINAFNETLQKLTTNTQAYYDVAKQLAVDSPAKRYQIEMNELKNAFSTEIAPQFFSVVSEVTKNHSIKDLSMDFASLAAEFIAVSIAFKGLMKFGEFLNSLWIAGAKAIATGGGVWEAISAGAAEGGVATVVVIALIAAYDLLTRGMEIHLTAEEAGRKAFSDTTTALNELNKASDVYLNKLQDQSAARDKLTGSAIDENFRQQTLKIQGELNSLDSSNKGMIGSLGNWIRLQLDTVNAGVQQFQQRASDLKNQIKDVVKEADTIYNAEEKRLDAAQLAKETPTEQILAMQDSIQTNLGLSQESNAEGYSQQGKTYYDSAISTLDELVKKKDELNKSIADDQTKLQGLLDKRETGWWLNEDEEKGISNLRKSISDQQSLVYLLGNLDNQRQDIVKTELDDLAQLPAAYEKASSAMNRLPQANALKDAQDALNDFIKYKVKTTGAKGVDEYKTPEQVSADLTGYLSTITTAINDPGIKMTVWVEAFKYIQGVVEEAKKAQSISAIDTQRTDTSEALAKDAKVRADTVAAFVQARSSADSQLANIEATTAELQKQKPFSILIGEPALDESIKQYPQIFEDSLTEIDKIGESLRKNVFASPETKETAISLMLKQIKEIQAILPHLGFTGTSNDEIQQQVTSLIPNFGQLAQATGLQATTYTNVLDKLGLIEASSHAVDTTFGSWLTSIDLFSSDMYTKAIPPVNYLWSTFSDMVTMTKQISDNLSGIQLPANVSNPSVMATSVAQPISSVIVYNPDGSSYQLDPNGPSFARGGFLSRGIDSIPAMLSPGEFVINAASTRRFYHQLVAMNAGIQPRHFSGGGSVSMGDINVSVGGGKPAGQTAREIAYALRREIRRGTVSL